STDTTAEVAAAFVQGKASWKVLRRPKASSPSCARNTGARAAQGELLFFLDGDDLFLPQHIAACCHALHDPQLDFVKTQVRLADPVHPDWKPRIDYSVVINLCLRRRCHEAIGGFPDYHLFRRVDDGFEHHKVFSSNTEPYTTHRLAPHFFPAPDVAQETAKHPRSPGTSYDRQYAKFCQPFNRQKAQGEEALRLHFADLLINEQIERLSKN